MHYQGRVFNLICWKRLSYCVGILATGTNEEIIDRLFFAWPSGARRKPVCCRPWRRSSPTSAAASATYSASCSRQGCDLDPDPGCWSCTNETSWKLMKHLGRLSFSIILVFFPPTQNITVLWRLYEEIYLIHSRAGLKRDSMPVTASGGFTTNTSWRTK
jgi:hypothetical protein